MALYGMVGQYAAQTPWSRFTAMALIIAVPVAIVYLSLQKYIVGGLTSWWGQGPACRRMNPVAGATKPARAGWAWLRHMAAGLARGACTMPAA